MSKSRLWAASEKDKRREEIVDFGLKLIHLWLENPNDTLSEILIKLDSLQLTAK